MSQPIITSHVTRGSLLMTNSAVTIPRIGTSGTNGVLNGRSISGCRTRSTQTPAHTIVNASSVPMFTRSDRKSMSFTAGMSATIEPTTIVEIHGVRNLGCTADAHLGSSPSLDIEKNTRDWPSSITSITVANPKTAPIFTSSEPQLTPVTSIPTATGSLTFSCGYFTSPVSTDDTRM